MRAAGLSAWFDPRGRLSRRAYGRRIVRLLLASSILLCAAIALGAQNWRHGAFVALGGIVGLGLAGLVQTVRRLHDRDRTGWWLPLFLAVQALRLVPAEARADAEPVAVTLYALGTLAVSLWFLVETLGCRGTRGANRYGPEPPGRAEDGSINGSGRSARP